MCVRAHMCTYKMVAYGLAIQDQDCEIHENFDKETHNSTGTERIDAHTVIQWLDMYT